MLPQSHDVQPKYVPQGAAYEYLPLNQNMYTRGRDGLTANNCAVKSAGFYEADDRYGIRQRAIKSENAGEIFMPEVRSLFDKNEKDATVSMWFRFDELPNEGSVVLMRRYCPTSTGSATDKQVAVLVSSSGKLLLDNNGVISEFERVSVGAMEWHLLTLVRKATKSLQLYLDDVEVGNVSSTATLGYAPYGSLHATFGGGACAIDDLTIYHTEFTSVQVRELYEASRPKPICHTVHQGIQSAQLNETNFYVAAEGCNLEVSLTVAQSVQWQAVPNCDWITIASDDQGAGSATVAFTVAPTTVVTNRIGSVTIAGIEVMVEQEGLWADVECDATSFGVESNFGMIYVETEGAGMWEAKTDCAWIHLLDAQGNGPGVALL